MSAGKQGGARPVTGKRLHMEFDQLRLFVDLVREQSFTKVAERNFITQPAVSLSIQPRGRSW
jgi:hypothetical protein